MKKNTGYLSSHTEARARADAAVRIPVLFVVKDEIYIKTLLGAGVAVDRNCSCCVVVDAAFEGVNGVSGFIQLI